MQSKESAITLQRKMNDLAAVAQQTLSQSSSFLCKWAWESVWGKHNGRVADWVILVFLKWAPSWQHSKSKQASAVTYQKEEYLWLDRKVIFKKKIYIYCHTKVAKLTLQLLDFPKQDFSSGLLFQYSGEQCHLVVTAIEQRRFYRNSGDQLYTIQPQH